MAEFAGAQEAAIRLTTLAKPLQRSSLKDLTAAQQQERLTEVCRLHVQWRILPDGHAEKWWAETRKSVVALAPFRSNPEYALHVEDHADPCEVDEVREYLEDADVQRAGFEMVEVGFNSRAEAISYIVYAPLESSERTLFLSLTSGGYILAMTLV